MKIERTMVKTRTLACLFLFHCGITSQASDTDPFTDALSVGVSLLQLRASPKSMSNSSNVAVRRSRGDPGASEREQCPHELEAELAAQGDKHFGCEGTMRAMETVECSFWGEPHITELFGGRPTWGGIDVFYLPGLWRMAAANDGSWEVQIFNCGVFTGAIAARFGKSIIEVFVDEKGDIHYMLNGEEVPSLPAEGSHGVKLTEGHRTIYTDSNPGMCCPKEIPPASCTKRWMQTVPCPRKRASEDLPGTCADNPAGQISIDIAQDRAVDAYQNLENVDRWHNRVGGNAAYNLNLKIEVAKDSHTTEDNDGYSLCNKPVMENGGMRAGGIKGWDITEIEPEKSLFTIGERMCSGCNGPLGWDNMKDGAVGAANHYGIKEKGEKSCAANAAKKTAQQITVDSICGNNNIAVQDAAKACAALEENLRFFTDCQVDYCASGGQMLPVEAAIEEEALENPQPVCFPKIEGGDCDPASKCCNALRDGAVMDLSNVVSSDLCSGGELRYGSALAQKGQIMDLVVKPVGDFECSGSLDDSKFGSKNAQIGVLGVRAKTEQAFEFRFVQQGTNTPVSPENLMMTFLDIDQGKKNKQRESISVCGSGRVVTTDDTELDLENYNDNCIKVTSTQHGTGKDNPDSIEGMSQMQRARTAAFEVTGSTFTATLAVSKKGRNPRRFNFAGHPSVACVLK